MKGYRRKTLETFPKNKIVLFPQTFFFTQDEDGKKRKKSQQIFTTGINIFS